MNGEIKDPTMRKVLNRGFIPIRYREKDQTRHGWIIEKLEKYWRVKLIGDDGVKRLRPMDQKHVTILGGEKNANPV